MKGEVCCSFLFPAVSLGLANVQSVEGTDDISPLKFVSGL